MLKFLAVEKRPLAEMPDPARAVLPTPPPPPPPESEDLLTAHFLTESAYYCYFSWLNIEIDRKKMENEGHQVYCRGGAWDQNDFSRSLGPKSFVCVCLFYLSVHLRNAHVHRHAAHPHSSMYTYLATHPHHPPLPPPRGLRLLSISTSKLKNKKIFLPHLI